jgi:hypothetical protein
MSQNSIVTVPMLLQDVSFDEMPPAIDEFIRLHQPTWDAACLAVGSSEDRESAACAILEVGVAALQLWRTAASAQERFCFRRIASAALHTAWQVMQEPT